MTKQHTPGDQFAKRRGDDGNVDVEHRAVCATIENKCGAVQKVENRELNLGSGRALLDHQIVRFCRLRSARGCGSRRGIFFDDEVRKQKHVGPLQTVVLKQTLTSTLRERGIRAFCCSYFCQARFPSHGSARYSFFPSSRSSSKEFDQISG